MKDRTRCSKKEASQSSSALKSSNETKLREHKNQTRPDKPLRYLNRLILTTNEKTHTYKRCGTTATSIRRKGRDSADEVYDRTVPAPDRHAVWIPGTLPLTISPESNKPPRGCPHSFQKYPDQEGSFLRKASLTFCADGTLVQLTDIHGATLRRSCGVAGASLKPESGSRNRLPIPWYNKVHLACETRRTTEHINALGLLPRASAWQLRIQAKPPSSKLLVAWVSVGVSSSG